ncbi:gamma-glutamylcyclotransferase family protein [Paludifilum halophilum]|uniref:Gamma-glutamylcyclotransferase AIG2-like domain-containing protein n=1 Tax=Paludifilum halophilum TaxID=1642702 RepID=A0A235B787_9BACL|nr:gamma-glutamylcyclotransferase family protein [Paludifilum halophilum]OYD07465.1 hypothetical protein CHM34_11225 [Paludifilum halophilum]
MAEKRGELVFVYGSLRVGEANHGYMNRAIPVAMQCWTPGALFDTGKGYPAMVPHEAKRVYGELYRVTEADLERLDELEDYSPGEEDSLYRRVRHRVHTDQGSTEAFVYVDASEQEADRSWMETGDWKSRRIGEQEEHLYFAYGSCMDDERIRAQGMGQHFEEIAGRGVLRGYSLRYTLPLPDGGRADIVEDGYGTVEGKVYRIGREAVDYLFWREGVDHGHYRPAWVRMEVNGRMVSDILTFLVIDKQPETAPPDHYAREILRGSRGTVSEVYHRKLRQDLREKFGMEIKRVEESEGSEGEG